MLAHDLSFSASWKMMTRDKGWLKPILVLTLIGWIPILGQIAILGYGFEWARLTAWGVDAAPKQRGVDYGKILTTGGRAFVISLAVNIVLGILESLIFGVEMGALGLFGSSSSVLGNFAVAGALGTSGAVAIFFEIVNMLVSTFIMVAVMRATIYDDFSAAWRIDRLFQMISDDLGGFLRVYVISLIAGLVNWLYSFILGVVGTIVVMGGAAGVMAYGYGTGLMGHGAERMLIHALLNMGPAVLLLVVVLGVLAMFLGGVISTAMQLVTVNATGQWFTRFDLARWGVSSAPLPVGVPLVKGFNASVGTGTPTGAPSAGAPSTAAPTSAAAAVDVNATAAASAATDVNAAADVTAAVVDAPAAADAAAATAAVDAVAAADAAAATAVAAAAPDDTGAAVESSADIASAEMSASATAPSAPGPVDAAPHAPIPLPPISELTSADASAEADRAGSEEASAPQAAGFSTKGTAGPVELPPIPIDGAERPSMLAGDDRGDDASVDGGSIEDGVESDPEETDR